MQLLQHYQLNTAAAMEIVSCNRELLWWFFELACRGSDPAALNAVLHRTFELAGSWFWEWHLSSWGDLCKKMSPVNQRMCLHPDFFLPHTKHSHQPLIYIQYLR